VQQTITGLKAPEATGAGPFVKKRAPTLYAIIAFKLLKGTTFVTLAVVAYKLSNDDLPEAFQNLLQFFRIQPDTKFCAAMVEKFGRWAADITETKMLWAAAGFFTYSLFGWFEGIGLLLRAEWAGWLAIGESIFFIPLEVLEIGRKPSWGVFIVLIINIIIVAYLLRNRRRLFKHYHHVEPAAQQEAAH
jgi:uncharacterized membrane protein (DUF2068 family)